MQHRAKSVTDNTPATQTATTNTASIRGSNTPTTRQTVASEYMLYRKIVLTQSGYYIFIMISRSNSPLCGKNVTYQVAIYSQYEACIICADVIKTVSL